GHGRAGVPPGIARRRRPAGVRPAGTAGALHLRIPEPDAVEPALGSGDAPESGSHLVDAEAATGPQDDRGVPEGPRQGAQAGDAVVPADLSGVGVARWHAGADRRDEAA